MQPAAHCPTNVDKAWDKVRALIETQGSWPRFPHRQKYLLIRRVVVQGLSVCGTVVVSDLHDTKEIPLFESEQRM